MSDLRIESVSQAIGANGYNYRDVRRLKSLHLESIIEVKAGQPIGVPWRSPYTKRAAHPFHNRPAVPGRTQTPAPNPGEFRWWRQWSRLGGVARYDTWWLETRPSPVHSWHPGCCAQWKGETKIIVKSLHFIRICKQSGDLWVTASPGMLRILGYFDIQSGRWLSTLDNLVAYQLNHQ